jgi:hypothetical protein
MGGQIQGDNVTAKAVQKAYITLVGTSKSIPCCSVLLWQEISPVRLDMNPNNTNITAKTAQEMPY